MKNKSLILIIVLFTGIALAYFVPDWEGAKVEPVTKKAAKGQPAPDFALKDIDGKAWRLSDLKGKVILLNFWATWCDSCKEENPSFQKLIESQKENANFAAVTILYNDSAQNALAYMKNNNLRFNVLMDDRKTSVDYGITGVPETFLISKKGIVTNKIIGPINWDTPEVRTAISKLLEES